MLQTGHNIKRGHQRSTRQPQKKKKMLVKKFTGVPNGFMFGSYANSICHVDIFLDVALKKKKRNRKKNTLEIAGCYFAYFLHFIKRARQRERNNGNAIIINVMR